jgi:hypothetical protein
MAGILDGSISQCAALMGMDASLHLKFGTEFASGVARVVIRAFSLPKHYTMSVKHFTFLPLLFLSLTIMAMPGKGDGGPDRGPLFGAYLAGGIKGGRVADQNFWMAGGGASLAAMRLIHLGVEGYTMASNITTPVPDPAGGPQYLHMGYAGFKAELVAIRFGGSSLNLPVLLAAGTAGASPNTVIDYKDFRNWNPFPQGGSFIVVAEPGAYLDIRLARLIHLVGGASYRMVGLSKVPGMQNSDFNGWHGYAALRIGWY